MLASWLESYRRDNIPKHTDFPWLPAPAGTVAIPKQACAGCPQQGKPGHKTCEWVRYTQPVGQSYRINLPKLRQMQELLNELHRCVKPMEGSQEGYLPVPQANTANFADYITWEVLNVATDVDGSWTLLTVTNGVDPRAQRLFTATIQPEELIFPLSYDVKGVPQRNDEVEILLPSVLCEKIRCRVLRVMVVNGNNITLKLDQSVRYLQYSNDPGNLNPTYYIRTWRQAGDPPRWPEVKNPDDNPRCCRHACRDWSNSNYGVTTGGSAVEDGHRWYCALRHYLSPYISYDERYEPHLEWDDIRPSKISTFTAHCAQTDCDHYAARTDADHFSEQYQLSQYLWKLWASVNILIERPNPGDPNTMIVLRPISGGNPSIYELLGGPPISSPPHMAETYSSPDWGCGFCGSGDIITDGSGNEEFKPLRGAFWDADTNLTTLNWGQVPGSGVISAIDGWMDRADPFGRDYNIATDPQEWARRHYHRASMRIQRDEGECAGYGPAAFSQQTQYEFIAPRVDLTATGVWQKRGDVWVKIFTTPVTLAEGFTAGALVYCHPLIEPTKQVWTVATGEVYDANTYGSGLIKVQIKNQTHTWSHIDNQEDFIISWRGNGGFVQAPDPYHIQSFYDTDKTFGAITDRCWSGDAVYFTGGSVPAMLDPGTDPDTGRPHHLFVVDYVQWGTGDDEGDWHGDPEAPSDSVCAVPDYATGLKGRKMDVAIIRDQNGFLADRLDFLTNATITALRCAHVANDSTVSPAVTIYQEDDQWAIGATDYLWRAGSGELYISVDQVSSMLALGHEWCFSI